MRASLQHDISVVVNEFGPQLFEDFRETRIIPPTSVPPPVMPALSRRRSTYGQGGQGTFFNHPLSASFALSGWVGLTRVRQAGLTSTSSDGLRKLKRRRTTQTDRAKEVPHTRATSRATPLPTNPTMTRYVLRSSSSPLADF